MILILTFIVFLTIFMIVINFFAILFRLTGLPIDKAKFQVISLLTSTGFTTKESELIAQHPMRRKLASWLMIFSYLSTAIIISFIIGIISNSLSDAKSLGFSAIIVIVFAIIVILVFRSSIPEKIEQYIEKLVLQSRRWNKALSKSSITLFQEKDYGIYELYIGNSNFLLNKSILESNLKDLEIQVLSIDKGDATIHFPSPEYIFELSDRITIYGNIENIKNEFNLSSLSSRHSL